MNKTIKKILKSISTVLVLVILVLAMLMVGVRIFGVKIYTVLSGSMEPEIHTGSLIYVTDVEPSELEKGDIITYQISNNMTATHRIVEVVLDECDSENIQFRTKGDANDTEDPELVSCDAVVGTPIFTIPYLGYLAVYVQQPSGMYLAIAISTAVLLVVITIDMLTDDKEEKNM